MANSPQAVCWLERRRWDDAHPDGHVDLRTALLPFELPHVPRSNQGNWGICGIDEVGGSASRPRTSSPEEIAELRQQVVSAQRDLVTYFNQLKKNANQGSRVDSGTDELGLAFLIDDDLAAILSELDPIASRAKATRDGVLRGASSRAAAAGEAGHRAAVADRAIERDRAASFRGGSMKTSGPCSRCQKTSIRWGGSSCGSRH